MADAPFRFVLIGTGGIASAYVDAIAQLGAEAALVGVVSRQGKLPAGLAEGPEVAPRLEALGVAYDAVLLATPNGLHHEGALAAAALGKHVLTEKVLEISLEACDRMISACQRAGVKLGVCYQRRTSATNRRVQRLIAAGAFGKIFAVEVEAKFHRPQSYYDSASYRGGRAIDGGGPFIQQAAHDLDLLTWFFGLPRHVASACGTFRHTIECEDHGAALLQYADGMIGTVIASTCCEPGQPARMTLHSELGRLILSGDKVESCELRGTTAEAIEREPVEPLAEGHAGILADFIHAVRSDRPPLISGEEGRKSVELIRRIYDSRFS